MLVKALFYHSLLLCFLLLLNNQWIYAQPPGNLSACNLQVNAGLDDTICEPGGQVNLNGSIVGDPLFFEWTPYTGLVTPWVLNPEATVTNTITYTLTAWALDPTYQNLVYNGDFSLGNVGFETEYDYVPDLPVVQNELYPDGTYSVVSDPVFVNDNWDECDPSPLSGGNMLVINGEDTPLDTLWCQTITVNPNSVYYFDGWMLSIGLNGPLDLVFSFNGENTPPIWYVANQCDWVQFTYPPFTTWNSGDTSSLKVCVLYSDFVPATNPVEIALDDISLVELCPVSDSVIIEVTDDVAPDPEINGTQFVCQGDVVAYDAVFPPETEILSYSWSVSSSGIIVSGQGTDQITVQWNGPGIGNVCLAINTFCHTNNGCLAVEVIDEPPDIPISGPEFLCPDEVGTLFVPNTSPHNEYIWEVPAGINILSGEGTNSLIIQWGNMNDATICIEVSNDCGSTTNCIDIQKHPGYETDLNITLCEGEVVVINGTEYGENLLSGTEYFTASNGCDSTVEIQITMESPVMHNDTLTLCAGDSIFLQGAYQTLPGTYTDAFVASGACDSIVLTHVSLTFPDTTWTSSTTCDTALAGTTISTYAQDGCDSIVADFVVWVPGDTTLISLLSCNPLDTGLTQVILQNQHGCDSIIRQHTMLIPPDSTFVHQTSCDSASLGVFEFHFTSASGCDSTVIQTVVFSEQDSTFNSGSSCDPAEVGVFVQMLTNGFGCDSIVTTTVSLLPSSENFTSATTCDPDAAGIFDYLFVNQFGCDSIVHETVSLLPSSETFLFASTCMSSEAGTFVHALQNQYGCDSIVMLTVSLVPADTTQLISKTCDPAQVGSVQNTFTNQDGCDSLVIQATELYPLPQLSIQVTSDFNGYDISCFGESDGSVSANVTGIGPYQYLWSTGSPDQNLAGLSAGNYAVTITDTNGCEAKGSITLIEPEEFSIGLEVSQPDCFDQHEGSILINQSGGVHPVRYSIDGINFQSTSIFNGLSDGIYTITALDANDCEVKEIVWINVPLAVDVDLGEDMTILPGDTTVIEAIVNIPFDSLVNITWSGLTDPDCPTCLSQPVAPVISTTYSISVLNTQGCTDSDSVVIMINNVTDLYIPNIFSPNGDNVNDVLLISAGANVEEIESLRIFDRWGNEVYTATHFQPDDTAFAWDGKRKDQEMNPGVYAYTMMVKFRNGQREIRNGDITLIR